MAAPGPHAVSFTIRGPIARSDLLALCACLVSFLHRSGVKLAVCDVAGLAPDAVNVDALARLQLTAVRLRCRVCLRNASPELLELIAFMGLGECLRGED